MLGARLSRATLGGLRRCRGFAAAASTPGSPGAAAGPASAGAPPAESFIRGDQARKATIDEMIRVDHAGEVAAVEIYRGQAWALRGTPIEAQLREMQRGEEVHLATMERLMAERRVRPSALAPLARTAGLALGVATALLGKETAMAATVAVETAIGGHYNDQVRELLKRGYDGPAGGAGAGASAGSKQDGELTRTFAKFRDEEMEHHDTALAHGAKAAPGFQLLSAVIQAGCAVGIELCRRV